AFGEYLGEATALLVAERIILTDRHDPLETVLQCPITEWMRKGAGGVAGDADDVADALTLGEIVGGDDGNEVRGSRSFDVIGDGNDSMWEQVPHQEMPLRLLHKAGGLTPRDFGVGSIVPGEELHFPAGNLAFGLVQPKMCSFDHSPSALSHHAGERCQQTH